MRFLELLRQTVIKMSGQKEGESTLKLACTETLNIYIFSKTSASAQERKIFPHPYPTALAVNKSPAVFFQSRALDGL